MSVVIGSVDKKEDKTLIKIGSDSYCTEPYNSNLAFRDSKKVFKHKSISPYTDFEGRTCDLIYGSVGNFKDKLDFKRFLNHKQQGKHAPFLKVSKLTNENKVFQLFKEYRTWCNHYGLAGTEHSSKFLLGCEAGLFYYDTEALLLDLVDTFIAIGAGAREATALLAANHSIDFTLEITCDVNKHCNGPYQLEILTINNNNNE